MSDFISSFFGKNETKPLRKAEVKLKTIKSEKKPITKTEKSLEYTLEKLTKSKDPLKKYDAVFKTPSGKEKIISFGKKGEIDFTQNNDKNLREFYDFKNSKKFEKANLISSEALNKWILWNKPTIEDSIKSYRKKLKENFTK